MQYSFEKGDLSAPRFQSYTNGKLFVILQLCFYEFLLGESRNVTICHNRIIACLGENIINEGLLVLCYRLSGNEHNRSLNLVVTA